MLRAMRRPSATASGRRAEVVAHQHHVGHALRDLGARAHRDRHPRGLQGRHVVDSVADHRRVAAAVGERGDECLLLLGLDAAEDRVAHRRLCEPRPVLRQVGAVDHPGVLGQADAACHRRHRRARVAGDQLQVDVLLAHELDGLACIRPEVLLHHDERPGPQRRRGRGRGVARQRARGLTEGDDPPPGRRLLLQRPLKVRRELERALAREDVGSTHHVGGGGARAVQRQPAPLPLG